MSSRIFRMWPAMVMALLLAAVWHWGVPAEPALAQGSSDGPVITLSPEWQWMGEDVVLSGTGYTAGGRVWAYVWSGDGEVPECRTVGVDANQVDDGLVSNDGSVSFEIKVVPPRFVAGDDNYLCLIDHAGLGADHRSARLRVVEPPDTYKMRLDVTSISKNPNRAFPKDPIGSFPDEFAVRGGKHFDNWNLPQDRISGNGDGDVLVRTGGTWHRCEDKLVADAQVGCEWTVRPSGNTMSDKVYLDQVDSDSSGPVSVPGDRVEFRVGLSGSDGGVTRAAERFVVFWGPVDVWSLGAPGGVEPQDFVIQEDHLAGLQSRLVVQSDLENGYFTLEIPRSSANRRGDTFVALVPCNDDYLEGNFEGLEFERAQKALRDCTDISVSGLPALSGEAGEGVVGGGYEVPAGVTAAWSQHDVRSGLGMSCRVVVANDSDDTENPNWVRTIECADDVARAVTEAEYDECIEVLSVDAEADDFAGSAAVHDLMCGRGHYDRPFGRVGSGAVWSTTRYNAARAFYGFVVDWQRGGGASFRRLGCGVDLLPYRLSGSGVPIGFLGKGTDEWLRGEYGAGMIADCVAAPGVHMMDVDFYTPAAYDGWSAAQQSWHSEHPVHFAVYVSGLSSGHDYRADGIDGAGAGWRRVWMGGRSVLEQGDEANGLRPLTSLGLAYPDVGDDAHGVQPPPMVELLNGYRLSITRDYADADGRVRLYVVPCRPLYSNQSSPEGRCADLPDQMGASEDVRFLMSDSDSGPFGVRHASAQADGHEVLYSLVVTVMFRSSAWGDDDARAVSPPKEWDLFVPAHSACGLSSRLSDSSLVDSVYWPEVTVQGGGCDRSDLAAVPVSFTNVANGRADKLVVYATGGRTSGLDLVQVDRVRGQDEDVPLGRLGVRERLLTLSGGESDTVLVSPDLADRNGDIRLVAYSCGNTGEHGGVRCPQVRQGRDTPVYDVAHPPSFVVRVRFLQASGLRHSDLGPVCQGDDCAPPVPLVLREAGPEVSDGACGVSSYTGGSSNLLYWPDRLVRGGACAPRDLSPVSVNVSNVSGAPAQDLVFYATGGRTTGFEDVQVRRGSFTKDQEAVATLADGLPAGASGLRRVYLDLDGGETGRLLVDADLADEDGTVLLLAYLCSGSSECPGGRGADREIFDVDRRPLFQVLVEYDAGLLMASGFSICKGDDCLVSYELERFDKPSGEGCSVSASYSEGSLYWPDRVIAGGNCDRYGLSDVPVNFHVPTSASDENLVVYVTGGRTSGLEGVSVRRGTVASSGLGRRSIYIPFPEDVDVGDDFVRANITATVGVLDDKPWVQDGLVGVEEHIYDAMRSLAGHYSGAESVAGMPFLDAVDETDHLTVRALVIAADNNLAGTVVGHSEFSGGITDSDRILVIGASMYSRGGADKVMGRLDDGPYVVEPQSFPTGETAQMKVSIARDQGFTQDLPGAADLVRKSVESMEEMMGRPFPTSHVIVFLDDGLFESGGANVVGVNYGGVALFLRPGADGIVATLLHEVAHYFWIGGRIWIDEGMAEAAVAIFGSDLDVPENELVTPKGNCGFDNLSELDAALSDSNDGGDCPYYLGQRLFWDLRETLGVADFRAGVRRLYEALLVNKARVSAWGTWATINDLRAAFSGNDDAQGVIARHWSGASTAPVMAEAETLGRLGLRQRLLTVPAVGSDTVYVSPDLAGPNGDVWLFAYRCDSGHGDSGCPVLSTPVQNGYDLPKGPDFAVRVRFTPASGLAAAELQRVCLGSYCDFYDPWLRRAEPSIDECAVQLGAHWDFWPDRVIRGGGCYFRGARYGPVAFRSAVEEKFVVYTTGGDERGLELVPVYGVLGDGSSSGVESDGVPLGQHGLRESSIELDSGGEEQVWVRADMADDDGNVWLFVYRCLESYNDAGCPLVDRDQVRPSYDLLVRPAFVVRVGFLDNADSDRSSLIVDCATVSSSCKITAIFRTADGETLPGTTEFWVDSGGLGEAGSAGRVSRRSHLMDAAGGHRFEETLILPPGSVVNVEAKLLGDGLVLRRQAGLAGNLDRLSVQIMRCSGDEMTCHAGGLERVDDLLAGERFVLQVTGYDAAGNEALSSTTLSYAGCVAGPSSPWPEFRLNSDYLRSHGYGTTQPDDRGYAGCTVRVLDDAPVGTYPITVSYGSVTSQVQIVVAEDTSKFGYLSLRGPSHLESGESGTYRVRGFTLAGEPSGFEGGCVELNLTGALEHVESGTAMDGCLAQVLPVAGVEFTVRASDGLVYETDSSVGVSYGGRNVRQHVLAVPAVDGDVASPSVSESHISDLTITQEDTQLKISWVSNPTSEFVSLRAQGWVMVGGVDVFLPGCQGGEVWETTTYEVFCLLSYGQSGDVYRAAVVFIRFDNSAMPVETAEWTRP